MNDSNSVCLTIVLVWDHSDSLCCFFSSLVNDETQSRGDIFTFVKSPNILNATGDCVLGFWGRGCGRHTRVCVPATWTGVRCEWTKFEDSVCRILCAREDVFWVCNQRWWCMYIQDRSISAKHWPLSTSRNARREFSSILHHFSPILRSKFTPQTFLMRILYIIHTDRLKWKWNNNQ